MPGHPSRAASAGRILALLLLLPPAAASATVWAIEADGSGDFATLQEAIAAAASGDTIQVGPGLYDGPFWIEAKNLVLRSTDGPRSTVLANPPTPSSDVEPVVHFFFEDTPGSEIEGFTIQHGESGIRCSSASPIIRGNIIQRNSGPLGAGICVLFGSAPIIEENLILGNNVVSHCCIASRGGGIYADDTSPALIRRNVIAGNRCIDQCLGGGISAYVGTIEENTIFGNRSDGPAGGVELPGEGLVLARNIIVANHSNEFADGIMVQRSALLSCNDVWNNGREDYWGTDPGEGDFSADPRFCDVPSPDAGSFLIDSAEPFDLRSDSPCLPGQHPGGSDCGTIGARPEGCGEEAKDPIAVPIGPRPSLRSYPNPTRGSVTVWTDPTTTPGARLEIIDASGRVIRRIGPVEQIAYWDGRTDGGSPAAAGVYFARISTPGSPPRQATILVIR